MTTDKNASATELGTETLNELIEISRFYGSNPDFVLAGGGNTSAKTGKSLYVKASGQALGTIGAEGFVKMDRDKLNLLLENELDEEPFERERKFKEAIYAGRLEPEKDQRPSVEVLLHNLIEQRFVVHTHSSLANMLSCCDKGQGITKELFGDDVLWIEFADPGYMLAKSVAGALKDYGQARGGRAPAAIIMQNHGLIVAGENFAEIRSKTDNVVGKISQHLDDVKGVNPFGEPKRLDSEKSRELINIIGPALRGLLANGERAKIVCFDDSQQALSLTCADKGPAATQEGPLIPDQIVYCWSFPMWVEAKAEQNQEQIVKSLGKAVAGHRDKYGYLPRVVLVRGLGLFGIGDTYAEAKNVCAVYDNIITVMAGAGRLGNIRGMSSKSREFIEGGEVETYRRGIAQKAAQTLGRVSAKIAVVTGGAQGFGLAIAEDLVKEGACVVLGDLNEQGAHSAANELCKSHGAGRALGLGMDVTDGESIQKVIDQTVRSYGGLDIFVSNAGVLKAESVKTQPVEDFDFVTAVNYRGYFLCVQKVVPVLAIQHLAEPDYMSDIIQINSKSGLVGSNCNGAYAGSKFGAIGLTQSFAMELIPDGIKVNSICPGNFLDGSLWSDPEKGLFVQYLRAGKVPGAKTIGDVRRAYEAKVPMGRGCDAADVSKAIYYIVEQKYETGQAVPVTGGQVMLRQVF